MKHNEQEQLVNIILTRINQLEDLLQSTIKPQEELSEQQDDEDLRSKTVVQATVDKTVLAQMQSELKQLHSNLEWLNQGHGGECEECGSSIPLARLLAVPATRLCVNCADTHENNN